MNTGKKATGEPISIGAVVGKTGPDDFGSSAAGAMAYFKCVNENGGINGRPVAYFVADDQWNPKLAADLADKLLTERKVVAMVGSASVMDCPVNAPRYAKDGITVIAGTGIVRECFHASSYAALNLGPRLSGIIAATYAAQLGPVSKMTCVAIHLPGMGEWFCDGVKAWGAKKGIKVETVLINPATFSAPTAMAAAAKSKPEVIVINLGKGMLIPMMGAAEKQDLANIIRFVSSAPAYSVDVVKALGPYWAGKFHTNLEFLPINSTGPDTRNWQGVMERYAQKTDSRDVFSQSGYLAARLTVQALMKLDPAKIDRASASQALHGVKGFASDMLCKPFYVGNGKRHNANNSGLMATYNGSGWTVAPGGCMTAQDPELADVQAEEKKLGLK